MASELVQLCALFQATDAVIPRVPDGYLRSAEWPNVSDECL